MLSNLSEFSKELMLNYYASNISFSQGVGDNKLFQINFADRKVAKQHAMDGNSINAIVYQDVYPYFVGLQQESVKNAH